MPTLKESYYDPSESPDRQKTALLADSDIEPFPTQRLSSKASFPRATHTREYGSVRDRREYRPKVVELLVKWTIHFTAVSRYIDR